MRAAVHKTSAVKTGSDGGVRAHAGRSVRAPDRDRVASTLLAGCSAGGLDPLASPPGETGEVARAAAVTTRLGQALPLSERAFFEPRFGRDLSGVRLHTDAVGGRAAVGIGARAYTLGNHIAFAPGEYQPSTGAGRRLIAHELAHTLQRDAGRTLRRTCPSDPNRIPPGDKRDFRLAARAIRRLDAFRNLAGKDKRTARHIIAGARVSACPMFYITELRTLFDTPVNPRSRTASTMRQRSIAAADAERRRLADPVNSALAGFEETETASRSQHYRNASGYRGTQYRIDDTDPADVYVHMKVWPRPSGDGKDEDVKRTVSLEDAIETAALGSGYLLDVEFVTRGGPDVFEVGVDPSRWVDARNWVGDPGRLAHEAHHLLGLKDRYNYLGHARNRNMVLGKRLHWFREQMVRAKDPLSQTSLMGPSKSGLKLQEQDVCALASGHYRSCLVTRFAMRTASEIEAIANGLSHPYRAQHAALLRVLSDAWQRRPSQETTANCNAADPQCGQPPVGVFGDPQITAADVTRFPLANPASTTSRLLLATHAKEGQAMSDSRQIAAEAVVAQPTASASLLQRACDCGGSAGVSGKCAECAAEKSLGVQAKLTVNTPGDEYEREADQIADRVISGRQAGPISPLGSLAATGLQRQDTESDEEDVELQRQGEDEEPLQMKGGHLQRQEDDEEEETVQTKPAVSRSRHHRRSTCRGRCGGLRRPATGSIRTRLLRTAFRSRPVVRSSSHRRDDRECRPSDQRAGLHAQKPYRLRLGPI